MNTVKKYPDSTFIRNVLLSFAPPVFTIKDLFLINSKLNIGINPNNIPLEINAILKEPNSIIEIFEKTDNVTLFCHRDRRKYYICTGNEDLGIKKDYTNRMNKTKKGECPHMGAKLIHYEFIKLCELLNHPFNKCGAYTYTTFRYEHCNNRLPKPVTVDKQFRQEINIKTNMIREATKSEIVDFINKVQKESKYSRPIQQELPFPENQLPEDILKKKSRELLSILKNKEDIDNIFVQVLRQLIVSNSKYIDEILSLNKNISEINTNLNNLKKENSVLQSNINDFNLIENSKLVLHNYLDRPRELH